ncbi:MAG: CoA transferase [Candidatus Rokubacteria bacterium]|nr:CoA transferase [Candidatus Rokubacteria bacterium]
MSALPLHGVRVLDLGQFIAMPFCTQWLAWAGADVIIVESRKHLTGRASPPWPPGLEGDPDATGYTNLLNGSKKSCAIDLSAPAGRELVRRLARSCDVMVDNFSTGVLEKLGLGYDDITRYRPDIIMLSSGAFGREGPLKDAMGFHSAVNLFSGLADVTGYPGGHGRILGGVTPDPLGGVYCVFAIVAALHHRRRTGEGQYIDVAMYELMLPLFPEAIIDWMLNGREPTRIGNRDREKAPHGIYPCRAADTWIAISIGGDDEWRQFCGVARHPEWATDPRFADVLARHASADALDAAVESWTRRHAVRTAVTRLQRRGIAAAPVLRTDELLADPQLRALGVVVENDHPKGGRRLQLGIPWRMDSLDLRYRRAPLLGEHTRDVLTELAGVTEEEYRTLAAGGVLS